MTHQTMVEKETSQFQDFLTGQVDVIIPTFNSERYIARCLRSVVGQGYPNLRLIVVDDGSTDNTIGIVESFVPSVECVRLNENRGPAAARNAGLRVCNGEFVAFLDSDDYWLPGFIDATVDFLKVHKAAIAVYTAFRAKKLKWGVFESLNVGGNPDIRPGQGVIENTASFLTEHLPSVATGAAVMRLEVVRRTQGQREDLYAGEDKEFWAYLATFGHWGFIPKPFLTIDKVIVSPRQQWLKFRRRAVRLSDMTIESWEKRIRSRLSSVPKGTVVPTYFIVRLILMKAHTKRYNEARALAETQQHRFKGQSFRLVRLIRLGLRLPRALWPVLWVVYCACAWWKIHLSHAFNFIASIGREMEC